jgi:hypothetical protein
MIIDNARSSFKFQLVSLTLSIYNLYILFESKQNAKHVGFLLSVHSTEIHKFVVV